MKKIFTLACAMLCAIGVSAQDTPTKKVISVDKTMVFYTTNDAETKTVSFVEDEDTGEEVEQVVEKFWKGADMVNAFNKCGIPLTGTSTTETQVFYTTRNDYVDPQTGFNMPVGKYRGVFIDGTIGLTGTVGTENIIGYKNIKSVVLYFFPLPTTWKAGGVSLQDYPTGRVQAQYIDENGAKLSNNCYREVHMDMKDGPDDGPTQIIKTCDVLNFSRTSENPLDITIDQPFKMEFRIDNRLDLNDELKSILASDNKGEMSNYIISGTEGVVDYIFTELNSTNPFDPAKSPGDGDKYGYNGGGSASGYDCWGGKWGTKIKWSPETITTVSVKKRLILAGIALVSATEGASSTFMNAADNFEAKWSDSAKAYGGQPSDPSGINNIAADNTQSANTQTYNLAGQLVGKSYKGIVVKGNKKFIQK
ncbi:MAG: hypothetical protein ACI3Y5_10595 [Prevotella sp.]